MAMTYDDYKAERRRQPASWRPLDDYDPEAAARMTLRGVPLGWPFCECGALACPDRGEA